MVGGGLAVCVVGRLYALAALCHLATSPHIRAQALAAGVVSPLLTQLDKSKTLPASMQRLSLSVLVRLTGDRAGCAALTRAGCMRVLHRHLSSASLKRLGIQTTWGRGAAA